MARVWKDRVLDTTTTTGTGTLTLAGAVTGYDAASAVGDGNGAYWCVYAVDAGGVPTGDWEVFDGVYTASGTTLTRAVVLASSNSGAAVTLAAGDKRVALVNPAGRSLVATGVLTAGRVPYLTTDGVVTDHASLLYNDGTGTLSATVFSGSGASLTALNGSNVSTGTVALARLPTGTSGTALPLLDGTNTWANTQTFTVAPVFTATANTRTALGLGTSATVNTGTSGATVPLLNGANTWSTTQTFTLAPVFTDASGSRTALGLGTAATQATGTSGATLPFANGTNTWANTQTFTVAPVFTATANTRTALGLGTSAIINTGTSGATIPLLNGANTWSTTQTFTVAPVFTDASGSRTALGLGTAATQATGTSGATLPFANGTNTWANTQTFTVAPVFTATANTRTALGLGTSAIVNTGTSGATIPLLNGANTWSGTANNFTITDTGTGTVTTLLTLTHNISSGTPGAHGVAIDFKGQSTTTADRALGHLQFYWADATDASRRSYGKIQCYGGAAVKNIMEWSVTAGGAGTLAFLNATPAVQQTGDAGTALVTFGLMSGTPTFASANLTGRAVNNVIYLREIQSPTVDGGTATGGAYATRTLNDEVVDTGSHCSLSSNQFTLTAGTYRIFARAPAYGVQRHEIGLYDTVSAGYILFGSAAYANGDIQNDSTMFGRFTIAASRPLEIRHYTAATSVTFGFGVATDESTISGEIYTEVWLEKEST